MKRIKLSLFIFALLFFVSIIPYSVSASDKSSLQLELNYQTIYTDGSTAAKNYNGNFVSSDNSPLYCVWVKFSTPGSTFYVVSKSQFSGSQSYFGQFGGYGFNIFYADIIDSCNADYYIIDGTRSDWTQRISALIHNGDSTGFEFVKNKGSLDFPNESDDIGTLILDKTKMYEESDGENVNDLYNLWSWKDKTSSGFSLSKNKYKDTRIQVRVESKCVVYSDFRHKKVKSHFDNYGEKGMLFDSLSPDSKPLKVSYLTDVPKVLPLTHAETHNPLFVGYDYTLYFRVVCRSDNGKWYSGGWRACDCNADILNGQTDTSENGHFDDNDNWVPDDDDGHNKIDSGSESVHDSGDAKDDFNNSSNKSDLSVDNAKNTIKDMLEMVGYIPTMIGTLFSFLPSWCLNMLAVFFVALCVLIVYKLIRG